MNDDIGRLDHLWFLYSAEPVLEDVTLTLSAFEFLTIIGPNGSGKTTLLKLLLGLIKPTQGSVRVLGMMLEQSRRQIGYVPFPADSSNGP
jgi:zinc transport system ATP-binding protein